MAAASFLLPKVFLIHYSNERLWMDYGALKSMATLAQDTLLAGAIYCLGLLVLRRRRWLEATFYLVGCGAILAVLMVDMRVRELWLRPLGFDLIVYAYEGREDLRSGADAFFHLSGFGLTFRKAALAVGSVFVLSWSAAFLVARSSPGVAPVPGSKGPKWWFGAAGVVVSLLIVCACIPPGRYHISDNVLLSAVVNGMRSIAGPGSGLALEAEAERCAQRVHPLATAVAGNRREILRDARPFRNVVIVMLESVRWKGMGFDASGETVAPQLMRMAGEGLFAKCHVSLPHSSKAYYAVLTGRHPYPDIEMRESMGADYSSIARLMSQLSQAKTYCFSSMYLSFENLDGLLMRSGIRQRKEVRQLPGGRAGVASISSFGYSDEALFRRAPTAIAADGLPFFCLLLPLAAHYPYLFPDKEASLGAGMAAYRKSVRHTDSLLPILIDSFKAAGLLEDTLFVFLGDHGESFGEHGTYIHNASMFEEETTVPLVFWSQDGRLRHSGLVPARQIDIAPTIADLLGAAQGDLPVQGKSLLLDSGHKTAYISSFFDGSPMCLLEHPYKFIYQPSDGSVARFDLTADPEEMHPVPIVEESQKSRIVALLKSFRAYQLTWKAHLERP